MAQPNKATLMLKLIIEKLQSSFSLFRKPSSSSNEDEHTGCAVGVPADVKEGHFAVWAVDGGKPKRFIISLGYLNHPGFLKLLDKTEEVFGFGQAGKLSIPCFPGDLQMILADRRKGGIDGG
ncbi:auxin-induced protein 15A-like [Magnolia sinica]|uniref:auxin-induced protein 15A-like n=1 Tax=Magnolia sinica TaxID=86752 RepID=UPI00265ACE5D|nr:auxin-induced protein 15A-like [Magnolia sinica]